MRVRTICVDSSQKLFTNHEQFKESGQGRLCLDLEHVTLFEPQRQKRYHWAWVSSEDSDELAHTARLIRIFTVRILNSQGCKVSSCGQWRPWSDCAKALADLSLRWAHEAEGMVLLVAAHFWERLPNRQQRQHTSFRQSGFLLLPTW